MLGCTYQDFIFHIGPKPEGNYQLDHICPCAQAQDENELLKLQHFSNFQWLEAKDNIRKKDKKTDEGIIMCKKLLNRDWR